MAGPLPATLRQLVLSQRLPADAVAAFVVAQARARAGHVQAAVDEAARATPLLAHVRDQLATSTGAVVAAAAVAPAAGGGAMDAPGAERLSAAVGDLSSAVRTGIDAHRPVFGGLRKEGRRSDVAALSALFDGLQYNAMGLGLQTSSLLARLRGAPPPVGDVHLPTLVASVLDDVRAFTVEKFGVAPPVVVETAAPPPPPSATASSSSPHTAAAALMTFSGVPEFASFAVSELLKNAFRAQLDRYGAVGVDDAPPVVLRLAGGGGGSGGGGGGGGVVSLRVSDAGGGLPGARVGPLGGPFPYFCSTFVPMDAGWTYSREHGVPFTGLGLGLVRAHLHARLLGGGLALQSQPGGGTDALAWFGRAGDGAPDFVPLLPLVRR
jgi:signal transduction histidine kinase